MGKLQKDFEKQTGLSTSATKALLKIMDILDHMPADQQRDVIGYLAKKTGTPIIEEGTEINWDDPESHSFGSKRPAKPNYKDDMYDVG